MKPSLAEIGNLLGGDSKAADRHMYGQIQSVITDASGKVTGYEVSLGGGSDTLRCRKIVGASVGDTVMVTRMANGIAVVTGTVGGDADALKALEETEDLEDMIGDGSTTGIKVATEYCLHTSNQTAPGSGAVWSEDLPAYIAGRYYWKRTKTTYADGSVVYSTPILDGLSQLSAEADYLLDSVNNHFWTDNTGAYVSENDKSYASGYATRIGSSGIAQMYNGVVLNTFTGSGITYYAYDPNASDSRVRLVTYGTTGIEFNDDIDFILGNALGNFIKWDSTQNKIIIHADTIEMGGTPVSTQDGNAWYTGTVMTYTDSTAHIYSNSGITDAHVGDMYLNTSTSNVYTCTVAGAANVAKWLYQTNIKGDNGIDVTSQYMAFNPDNGLRVYSGNKSVSTYNTSYTQIHTTGIDIVSDGVNRARFAETTRIGSETDFNIQITPQVLGAGVFYAVGQTIYGSSSLSIQRPMGTDIPYLIHGVGNNGVLQIKTPTNEFQLADKDNHAVFTRYNTSTDNYASGFCVQTLGKNTKVSLHIGSSGNNHGVYSNAPHDKWIIHANSAGNVLIPMAASSSTKALYITSDGKLQTTSSSRSVKKDIEDINNVVLDPTKLYDLRVAQFRYKDPELWGEGLFPGFIAEEMLEVYPSAACSDGKGGATDWEPRNIIPPMLKLIQLQKKQIDKLEERFDRLYA